MLDRKLSVFLCHSSQDKPIVRGLYQRLLTEGWIDPWLDEEKLLPGMDWDEEIQKAVEASDSVLVCLSSNSVKKTGYVQKELRFVLDFALYQPLDETIFIIPIRLDDCPVPRVLQSRQYADYYPAEQTERVFHQIIAGLRIRAKGLGIDVPDLTPSEGIDVQITKPIIPESEEEIPRHDSSLPGSIIKVDDEEGLKPLNVNLRPIPPKQPMFDMSATLVSNEMFYLFTQENIEWSPVHKRSQLEKDADFFLKHWENDRPKPKDNTLPVININFLAAEAFLQWLGEKTNLILRLPTRSEWELAARAGRDNWLEEEIQDGHVNYYGTYNKLAPVNSFSANPYGIRDLLGNACDLCVETSALHRGIFTVGGCYYSTQAQLRAVITVQSLSQCLGPTSFRYIRDL